MRRLFIIVVLLLNSPLALAAENKLMVGTYIGLHRPALEDLSEKEFRSPVGGIADIIVDAGDNRQENFIFNNPLPNLGVGVNAGLEFLWELSDKYSFIVGGGTWESTARSLAYGSLYLQGQAGDFVNERTAKISFNEFYFGLRYNLIRSPKNFKAYYRLTLNEVFDIDYREDLIFLFTSGDAEGVKKSIILESQATGLLMIQPGFGVDYSFNDLVSVGIDASYVIGTRRVTLRDGKSKVDFLDTDNLSLWLPQRVDPVSGDLQYLSQYPVDNQDYSTMRLSFDGWKLLMRFNVSF